MERTFTVTDHDGPFAGVPRQVTLAQFRADIDARKAAAQPIMDAIRRGDAVACEAAQTAFRKRFA